MAASPEDVKRWIKTAKEHGFTHIISVCDTFDWDDYPVYVLPGDDLEKKKAKYDGVNMQKINEVIEIGSLTEDQETVMNDADLKDLLDIDPLAEAEKITGRSYKEEDPNYPVPGMNETTAIGFSLNYAHGRRKERILREMDDTTSYNSLEDYIRIITEEGFVKVLELPFIGDGWGDPVNETLFVFWNPDGILLSFDTYGGNKSVNGSTFRYNWVTNSEGLRQEATSSGGMARHDDSGDYASMWDIVEGKVAISHAIPEELAASAPHYDDYPKWDEFHTLSEKWADKCKAYFEEDGNDAKVIYVGNHDGREALRLHIRQLRKHGSFLPQWVSCDFLWLLHYMDTKRDDYDYKAINKERVAMLPKHIQKAINYGERDRIPMSLLEQECYSPLNVCFRKYQGTIINGILGAVVLSFFHNIFSSM